MAGFTYSACGPLTKHRQSIKIKKQVTLTISIRNNCCSTSCFPSDAAHFDSKDLAKRHFPDKILKDRSNKIPKNCKHDSYPKGLANMVYKIFDKKNRPQELYKPVIKKFKSRKVCARFKDNVWVAYLAK